MRRYDTGIRAKAGPMDNLHHLTYLLNGLGLVPIACYVWIVGKLSILIALIALPNATGCAGLIAYDAVQHHYNVRAREVEYRHQERMYELKIQERQLEVQSAHRIIRDNPF